ncbi:citrate lyase beta subunit [Arthrobacter globiformis]|nr:citrate lyase beta subunit [Arthrobacter globiformis]
MKTDLFDQSAVSRADAIILDVEDAVDPSQKDTARNNVVNWLTAGGQAWVRINDATSPFWADDLAGLRGTPGLLGIMLAKTESADQVTESFHRMDGKTPVIPLVESAVGIEEANNIVKAQGAFRLAFGSGDFRRDTGMAATAEAMAYPRANPHYRRLGVSGRIGLQPYELNHSDPPFVGVPSAGVRRHRKGPRPAPSPVRGSSCP